MSTQRWVWICFKKASETQSRVHCICSILLKGAKNRADAEMPTTITSPFKMPLNSFSQKNAAVQKNTTKSTQAKQMTL